MTFPKDDITDKTVATLKVYMDDPSFNAEDVGKVSFAAKGLCMWGWAMVTYN
jgi:hypothetical protein